MVLVPSPPLRKRRWWLAGLVFAVGPMAEPLPSHAKEYHNEGTLHHRILLEKEADFANGNVLGVSMELPNYYDSPLLDNNNYTNSSSSNSSSSSSSRRMDVTIQGKAYVGLGVPEMAYLYIIDASDSTSSTPPPPQQPQQRQGASSPFSDYYDTSSSSSLSSAASPSPLSSSSSCGTALECEQTFYQHLHAHVQDAGTAQAVAVVEFDDHKAQVTAPWQHPSSPFISQAISTAGSSSSSSSSSLRGQPHTKTSSSATTTKTPCQLALELASKVALDPHNTATTTVIIFASGHDKCSGVIHNQEKEDETVDPLLHLYQRQDVNQVLNRQGHDDDTSVSTVAAALGQATGAMVHAIAVGDHASCDNNNNSHNNHKNDLQEIPQNGGRCWNVPNPHHVLPAITDTLLGTQTELLTMTLQINGGAFMILNHDDHYLSDALPRSGPTEVSFEAVASDLQEGEHEICLRATGRDFLSGFHFTTVKDCQSITIRIGHGDVANDDEDSDSAAADLDATATTAPTTSTTTTTTTKYPPNPVEQDDNDEKKQEQVESPADGSGVGMRDLLMGVALVLLVCSVGGLASMALVVMIRYLYATAASSSSQEPLDGRKEDDRDELPDLEESWCSRYSTLDYGPTEEEGDEYGGGCDGGIPLQQEPRYIAVI